MLVGKCTKCGKRYIGWALSRPEHQACLECGGRLVVRNMNENYQPGTETVVTVQRTGIAEWQEALEDVTTHFII
jgi:DNA-directed RNA polymerase subunit RPC12/RpoP